MNALSMIKTHKLVSILRGLELNDALSVTKALKEGGFRLVEVTMNTKDALNSIEQLNDIYGEEMLIGAGTVLDSETAKAAIQAGASFIISPSLDLDTIKTTKRYGAVSIPGAFTPTEILKAYEHGADIIKVFPADTLGPSFIKNIQGPFPNISIMPTGGVNLNNVESYIKTGVAGVGIGSSLVNSKKEVNKIYLDEVKNKATRFVEIIQ